MRYDRKKDSSSTYEITVILGAHPIVRQPLRRRGKREPYIHLRPSCVWYGHPPRPVHARDARGVGHFSVENAIALE